ncbi:hypothetical protein [uncultured Thiodictyon sp.]|uniref:hypothetical protein n=1 Tax=uncultured Thiodictyon sp. TaxID=1846217 RepID=UPI0025D6BE97|nr:hypothetical protein [uncultured Thiodictyon sp.]
MSLITAKVLLKNPRKGDLQPVEVDLIVIANTRTIDVNPGSPNIATSIVKLTAPAARA